MTLPRWEPNPLAAAYLLRDALVNVAIYVPLGLSGGLTLIRKCKPLLASVGITIIGGILSLVLETLQSLEPARDSSAWDVLANTAGAALGAALALILRRVFRRQPPARRDLWEARAIDLALFTCWLVSSLGLAMVHYGPTGPPLPQIWHMAAVALTWMALGGLLSPIARAATPALLLLIAALLGGLAVAMKTPLSRFALPGVFLGCALAWGSSNSRHRDWLCALALISAIVIRGLAPFDFTTASVSFSWTPFAGLLGLQWHHAVRILLEKVFYYGASLWLLERAGCRRWVAVCLVTFLLLGIELAQTHLPSHTPEITDPILALLAGLVLTSTRPQE